MKKLVALLAEALPRRLALLDAGARGGLQHPWDALRPVVRQILVEADPAEAQRLRAKVTPEEGEVLPVALWRERGEVTLHVTRSRGCSSVLRPNRAVLDAFPESDRFEIEQQIPMQAVSVDDLAREGALPVIDFAKIDVQGAELAILAGGRTQFVSGLVGLEVEVEFCAMYEDQPLFSDVETFVRKELGLEVWDIRKTYWKYRAGIDAGAPKGRLIFGDALFLRPPGALGAWLEALGTDAARDKAAMLVVAALAYGYADYAAAVLDAAPVRAVLPAALAQRLRDAVRSVGRGCRPLVDGHGRLYLLLDALARAVKPTHGRWAASGQALGSRRRGPFWL